jgi:4'-phosphopantetheinyl transferase
MPSTLEHHRSNSPLEGRAHPGPENLFIGRKFYQQMIEWLSTKQFPKLLADQVHVWRVCLNHIPTTPSRFTGILSPDEQERAVRFNFEKNRNQFIEARAALRLILSGYLKLTPEELEFSYGAYGKPALANGPSDNRLRFNLSRRDGLALIAVASGREVGVDVEYVRPDLPVLEIAECAFSAAEIAALESLPKTKQTAGFYNCWTRKEAYVKARGEGVSFPMKQFDVSLNPGAPAALLEIRDDDDEIDRWTLQELPVSENYLGALAVEGANVSVAYWNWDWSQSALVGEQNIQRSSAA